MLGGNEFRLRQGFAAQNAWDAGLPAVRIPKEQWGRLTNTVVSGTMSARNGGFAVAPYLCRDYYNTSSLAPAMKNFVAPYLYRDYCFGILISTVSPEKGLHLTYAGIKYGPKRQKAKLS